MTDRRQPRGIDRADMPRDPFVPIKSERAAQEYGANVHSLDGARDRRDQVIWSIDGPDAAA